MLFVTRARDQLHLIHPRRFYTTAQAALGDRYVDAPRSRFVPEALLHLFEHRVVGFKGATRDRTPARAKLPKLDIACLVGDFTARLMSYLQPKGVGSYLRTHLGRVMRFDNGKIRRELGLGFRPATQSILETCADLEKWGHIQPRA